MIKMMACCDCKIPNILYLSKWKRVRKVKKNMVASTNNVAAPAATKKAESEIDRDRIRGGPKPWGRNPWRPNTHSAMHPTMHSSIHHPSTHSSVHPSIHSSIRASLFTCLFACLFVCLFVCFVVCLFVCLFVCLLVCLCVC